MSGGECPEPCTTPALSIRYESVKSGDVFFIFIYFFYYNARERENIKDLPTFVYN